MNKSLPHRHTKMIVLALFALVAATGPGCAKPAKVDMPAGKSVSVEGFDATSKRIEKDPIAFLKESLNETRKLKEFTSQFQRQERLGLLPELHPAENILAEYRDDPFSVRFTWRDADSEYLQCVFVKGKNDDKVLILSRKSPLGPSVPPSVAAFPTSFATMFQKARNPITDFGPRRMMERTLERIEKAQTLGVVQIRLDGASEIGPAKEPCFHIELRYPKGDPYPCKLQDLYIHTRTHLPVASYLWLPGKIERTDATLDALYQYAELNSDVKLTDANFVIDKHPPTGNDKRETASLATQTETDAATSK